MLDKNKVKKGDRVYRMKWVDYPDTVQPQPAVGVYEIVELGQYMAAVREVYQGPRLKGQLGGKEKRATHVILAHHFHTPAEAIAAEIKNEERNSRDAEKAILRAAARKVQLATLAEAITIEAQR